MLASTGANLFYQLELDVAEEIYLENLENKNSTVTFKLLDAMKLTRPNCAMCPDGRHFHNLNYLQAYVLVKGLMER